MKPYLVVLGGEYTYAVYAPNSKNAVDKVYHTTGYSGSQDEASVDVADDEALDLFDDEFAEARRTNKPVKLVTG